MTGGKVTPAIDRRYSLSEVPAAIRYLEQGHAPGKVVVRMSNLEKGHAFSSLSPSAGDAKPCPRSGARFSLRLAGQGKLDDRAVWETTAPILHETSSASDVRRLDLEDRSNARAKVRPSVRRIQ